MPHHLIIVDTDVVFHRPNSRLYHNQRNAREYNRVIGHTIDVFIILVDGRFDQAVDVATMFTCTLFPPHRICIV